MYAQSKTGVQASQYMRRVKKFSIVLLIFSTCFLFFYEYFMKENLMQYAYDHINEIFCEGDDVFYTEALGIGVHHTPLPKRQRYDIVNHRKLNPDEKVEITGNNAYLTYVQKNASSFEYLTLSEITFKQFYKIDEEQFIAIAISYRPSQSSFFPKRYYDGKVDSAFGFEVTFNDELSFPSFSQEDLTNYFNNCFASLKTNFLDKVYNYYKMYRPNYWGFSFSAKSHIYIPYVYRQQGITVDDKEAGWQIMSEKVVKDQLLDLLLEFNIKHKEMIDKSSLYFVNNK